jgi:hypothetical protein
MCGGGLKLVWMNVCVVIRMLVRMHVLCFKLLVTLFGWVCSRARILYHVIVCTSQWLSKSFVCVYVCIRSFSSPLNMQHFGV